MTLCCLRILLPPVFQPIRIPSEVVQNQGQIPSFSSLLYSAFARHHRQNAFQRKSNAGHRGLGKDYVRFLSNWLTLYHLHIHRLSILSKTN